MIHYRDYITSNEWRSKHKDWLKQANYRCAFTGIRVGRKSGRGYNMHHTNYLSLGNEKYGDDVLVSWTWFHNWVIHGILSGFKSAGKQGDYPNKAQRLVHSWGRLPYRVKQLSLWLFLLAGTYSVTASALFLSGLQLPSEGVRPPWGTSTQFLMRSVVKMSHQKRFR